MMNEFSITLLITKIWFKKWFKCFEFGDNFVFLDSSNEIIITKNFIRNLK